MNVKMEPTVENISAPMHGPIDLCRDQSILVIDCSEDMENELPQLDLIDQSSDSRKVFFETESKKLLDEQEISEDVCDPRILSNFLIKLADQNMVENPGRYRRGIKRPNISEGSVFQRLEKEQKMGMWSTSNYISIADNFMEDCELIDVKWSNQNFNTLLRATCCRLLAYSFDKDQQKGWISQKLLVYEDKSKSGNQSALNLSFMPFNPVIIKQKHSYTDIPEQGDIPQALLSHSEMGDQLSTDNSFVIFDFQVRCCNDVL